MDHTAMATLTTWLKHRLKKSFKPVLRNLYGLLKSIIPKNVHSPTEKSCNFFGAGGSYKSTNLKSVLISKGWEIFKKKTLLCGGRDGYLTELITQFKKMFKSIS